MKKSLLYILIALFNFIHVEAQVGIGTETPNASSILDIESSEEGVLLPRMTTDQREAISAPANGLTVFDTDAQTYYFYNDNESQWEQLSTSRLKRSNYQLVQSEDDFPAPSGGIITLDSDTFYEINGMITLENSIELNGAYISGFDSFEDGLDKPTGDLFVGTTGGSLRFLTLSGGAKAFNITGGPSQSLIVQNSVFKNFSKVGNISNVGLVFFSITQYLNNEDGLTYKDIGNLLLSNSAWQGNNSGTYEKFDGTFDLIQKQSGFSIANGSVIAIDVSDNPNVSEGIISGTGFSGNSSKYIEKYTTSPSNLNFTNNWFVQAPGIQDEFDDVATGNNYYNGTISTGYNQTSATTGTPFKLNGSTSSTNLKRFTAPGNNRLTYQGAEEKNFSISASLSVRSTGVVGTFYSFFIRKNGTQTLDETNAIFYVSSNANVSSLSITGNVNLAPGDFIEIWGQKLTGTGSGPITVFSQNMTVQ